MIPGRVIGEEKPRNSLILASLPWAASSTELKKTTASLITFDRRGEVKELLGDDLPEDGDVLIREFEHFTQFRKTEVGPLIGQTHKALRKFQSYIFHCNGPKMNFS